MLSEIANAVFPSSSSAHFMFWVIQVFTFGILILAANTSYQGFPRLAAIMAKDGFFPRQFSNLGDRLVFSNGVVVLALLATALILVFSANVNSLIHLYVLGVFTAFTISQAGMVRHWFRVQGPGWRGRALAQRRRLHRHRARRRDRDRHEVHRGRVGGRRRHPASRRPLPRDQPPLQLRLAPPPQGGEAVLAQPVRSRTVLLYVERLDPSARAALWYAQTIANGDLRAIHVPFEGSDPGIKPRFFRVAQGNPHLEVIGTGQRRSTPSSTTCGSCLTARATSSRS